MSENEPVFVVEEGHLNEVNITVSRVEVDWIDAILDSMCKLELLLDTLGLSESSAVVCAQRQILMSHIDEEIQKSQSDPLLNMMQRLLDRYKETDDTRGYLQVAPYQSDLNKKLWRTTNKLHHQIHQANMAGYHWPENLHLMLEQRDFWDAEDVQWLIMRAAEYLRGEHDAGSPMTVKVNYFA